MPALTPLDELEQRVEDLEREQALRAGLELLGTVVDLDGVR